MIVSSPAGASPERVRYAWQSNPDATLFNGEGLPADPFRTDNWPGLRRKTRGHTSNTKEVFNAEFTCLLRMGGFPGHDP